MNKKTTSGFTVMEVICCLPLLTAIFIELPLPLQILLPFVSFVSLIGLARLHIAEIRSWKLKIFLEDLESCINDSQDLRKFILGVFIDTFVVLTLTGLVLISSGLVPQGLT